MSSGNGLVQRLWSYCNILRNDSRRFGVAEVERGLSVVHELEAVVSANLQRATRLRQSVLQKALSG